MIRDFRPTDAAVFAELLKNQFPEEEAIMGSHPEMVSKIVRRVYRWDTRLILGLARAFRRPVFRFLVYDEGGRLVGTTMLTFPGRESVYISMVATDPSVRRRGFARALLQRAQEFARKLGRQYLVLDVLAHNTPARALYEGRLGYRPLEEKVMLVRENVAEFGAERSPLPTGVRLYRRSDDPALLAIARARIPPEVARVLPRKTTGLSASRLDQRILGGESRAWVVDRGHGPEAGIGASCTPYADAAYITDPIVSPSADPALVAEMIRVAGSWSATRKAQRLAGHIPVSNEVGRAALEKEGFHAALSVWTLYRPVA
jgi:ribosomal protein S18 acetylase RimI-like enzyme